jgi:ABC-type multidrug transport system fused ATPase/permease subunit
MPLSIVPIDMSRLVRSFLDNKYAVPAVGAVLTIVSAVAALTSQWALAIIAALAIILIVLVSVFTSHRALTAAGNAQVAAIDRLTRRLADLTSEVSSTRLTLAELEQARVADAATIKLTKDQFLTHLDAVYAEMSETLRTFAIEQGAFSDVAARGGLKAVDGGGDVLP